MKKVENKSLHTYFWKLSIALGFCWVAKISLSLRIINDLKYLKTILLPILNFIFIFIFLK